MRRTVATLLVVASPLLTAVPVGAAEARPAGPAPLPAAPAVVPAPAGPAPVVVTPPVAPAPAPAPVVHAPAVAPPTATATTATAAPRPVVRALRPKAPSPAALSDAAYTARLQAELCRARQIFCGLDNGGRYPAR